jgi:hypothetical protein
MLISQTKSKTLLVKEEGYFSTGLISKRIAEILIYYNVGNLRAQAGDNQVYTRAINSQIGLDLYMSWMLAGVCGSTYMSATKSSSLSTSLRADFTINTKPKISKDIPNIASHPVKEY